MAPARLANGPMGMEDAMLATTKLDYASAQPLPLPWNHDVFTLTGLIIFLLVAVLLFTWNAFALHRVLKIRTRDREATNSVPRDHGDAATNSVPRDHGDAAGTPATTIAVSTLPSGRNKGKRRGFDAGPWWTKARLAKLQLFAAAMHVANQSIFLVQFLGRDMNCQWLGSVSSALYALMVLPSTAVLILQSTMLVPAWRRPFKRTVLFVLVAGAMGLIAGSAAVVSRDWALLATGVCSIKHDRTLNTAGKATLVVMYMIILLVLVRPMVRHVLEMRKLQARPGMQRNEHSRRLEKVVLTLLVKLVLVVLLVTLASVLGILNVFGRFWEFSLQNLGMICASTLALDRLRPGRAGSSSASTTGGNGNVEDGTDNVPLDGSAQWSLSNAVAWQPGINTPKLTTASEPSAVSPRASGPALLQLRIDLSASETAAAVAKLMGATAGPDEKAKPVVPPPQDTVHAVETTTATAQQLGSFVAPPPTMETVAGSGAHPLRDYFHTGDVRLAQRVASGVWVGEEVAAAVAYDRTPLLQRACHRADSVPLARSDVWRTAPEYLIPTKLGEVEKMRGNEADQEQVQARREETPLMWHSRDG
ncbi:hypothetical protein AMAG_05303 [Allomyces macrogynus ATCC 38327]|uniref:Uncharacterized protein n=1 Tax=Allomyces macrogynus (strain ATCC 38327) TaxID=578462 RepID=A0A0L0SBS1_ALLM3|nr:hypothetical protein AMAG_05303 [Allomyces macrogynus ATCC 38327]|eukprot:KNE59850.1 hypothetical protein AMAG_05303 [Allomyces macrogynus ATCC 38327]